MESPRTLLGLPPELRLDIFERIFREVVVDVERAGYSFPDPTDGKLSLLPTTPQEVVDIKLVCRTFAQEIGGNWHSLVTYDFPSTVAFLDILSQWSPEQVRTVRHARVYDSPLPLQVHRYYEHMNLKNALPLFPGLQLDTLTVENLWLGPEGHPGLQHCLRVTYESLKGLSMSKGWKRFYYVSGIMGLTPSQKMALESTIESVKSDRSEPDLDYGFGRIRPLATERSTPRDRHWIPTIKDDLETLVTQTEEQQEVLRWYQNNPHEILEKQFPNVSEKQVSFWMRRGEKAEYVQDGTPEQKWIEELLEHTTWTEFRRSDGLTHDALDDPYADL